MHDEDQQAAGAQAAPDPPENGAEEGADAPGPEAGIPDRRPIRGLGGAGCLVMVLAALAAMALLSTGKTWALAAGVLIFAVAMGAGIWLYNVSTLGKK